MTARQPSLPGAVLGALLMIGCVAVAYPIARLVDLVSHGTFMEGRGYQQTGMTAAALIAVAGLWWLLARRHRWSEMLGSLLAIELLIAGLVSLFSATTLMDSFFFSWVLGLSLYVGFPWLVAIVLGLVLRRVIKPA